MSKLFLSHSTADDAVVLDLQRALADFGIEVWIDSRELDGGDLLWPEVAEAIESAAAYTVLVSTNGLQSRWVGKELKHALALQAERGRKAYPVIPLSLNGTKLGVLEAFFADELAYILISGDPGGIDAALDDLLVALGKRLPTDRPILEQPPAEPIEELVWR